MGRERDVAPGECAAPAGGAGGSAGGKKLETLQPHGGADRAVFGSAAVQVGHGGKDEDADLAKARRGPAGAPVTGGA